MIEEVRSQPPDAGKRTSQTVREVGNSSEDRRGSIPTSRHCPTFDLGDRTEEARGQVTVSANVGAIEKIDVTSITLIFLLFQILEFVASVRIRVS